MDQTEQIRIQQAHAFLIHQAVKASQDHSARDELNLMLQQALAHGWEDLVVAIRRIVNGERDASLANHLDEEDAVVVRTILHGISDPASLPKLPSSRDARFAAPGLATLIHQATTGDSDALDMLEDLIEQMMASSGDMHFLGKALRQILSGETDPALLNQSLPLRGQKLLAEVVTELGRLSRH